MLRWVALLSMMALLAGMAALPAAAQDSAEVDSGQLRHGAAAEPETARSSLQAAAETMSTNCPYEITEDTTLTSDCPGLHVTASGVTVDLGGHTVRGVLIQGHGVTVRNGTITGHTLAVYVIGHDALLEEVEVIDTGGFAVEAGLRTTIRNSTFRGNTGVAVDQYFASALTVEDSTFIDNWTGVSIQSGRNAVIRGNRFESNLRGVNVWDEDGAQASSTQVLANTFRENAVGVRVNGEYDASDTVVEGNTIHRSGASGVLVTTANGPGGWLDTPGGAAGTVVRGNTINQSGSTPQTARGCWDEIGMPQCETVADDGITVLSLPEVATTMTVADNKAIKNAGYGIEAPGVTDGGGNVAAQNGAGGCLGVVCR